MAIAFLSAERSKDQVGACLVSQDGVILGIGYNGFPRGCSDDKLPWAQDWESFEDKVPRLYVTMFPCNECAKIIIQLIIIFKTGLIYKFGRSFGALPSGVSEVIYFVEKRLKKFRYCICCLSQATVIGWCKACRPRIFFINGFICFLGDEWQRNGERERERRRHFKEKMSLEEAHHHRRPWIRAWRKKEMNEGRGREEHEILCSK
ncbi:putative deoxycytidylate deaminase [Glycine max]|nr:putative deoxycytidylate deaminase [Glycine max]